MILIIFSLNITLIVSSIFSLTSIHLIRTCVFSSVRESLDFLLDYILYRLQFHFLKLCVVWQGWKLSSLADIFPLQSTNTFKKKDSKCQCSIEANLKNNDGQSPTIIPPAVIQQPTEPCCPVWTPGATGASDGMYRRWWERESAPSVGLWRPIMCNTQIFIVCTSSECNSFAIWNWKLCNWRMF